MANTTLRFDDDKFNGKVTFAIGTGRCGTVFLYRVLDREPDVAAFHEKDAFSDAFHRYCRWNRLQVDPGGFVATKRNSIKQALCSHHHYFESSAYLSLSVHELYEQFRARFVLLVRRPDRVVNSYMAKGWYDRPIVHHDYGLPVGYQPDTDYPGRLFARIVPYGDEAEAWHQYTQVGKLAWYWRALNGSVLDLFSGLPATHWRVIRLEDLSYETYCSLAEFMGVEPTISARDFGTIAEAKPNTLRPSRSVHDWTDRECEEFEFNVRELAERLGYEWQTERLKSSPKRIKKRSGMKRLKQRLRERWRNSVLKHARSRDP